MSTDDEVDGVIKTLEEEGDPFSWDVSVLIRRLRDERDQARAALEPFASAASLYPDDADNYSVDEWGSISAGHLRHAARVHAETGEKG